MRKHRKKFPGEWFAIVISFFLSNYLSFGLHDTVRCVQFFTLNIPNNYEGSFITVPLSLF